MRDVTHRFQPNTLVHDRWWPFKGGKVTRRLRTKVHVTWSDGEVWVYDLDHLNFLEVDKNQDAMAEEFMRRTRPVDAKKRLSKR